MGLPLQAPPGTISGWDIRRVWLNYDPGSDTMFAGFETFGVSGDADGDGDPGGNSSWLLANGGVDEPDFEGTESFALMLDVDDDGDIDVIAGVGAFGGIDDVQVAVYDPGAVLPMLGFGAPLPGHAGIVYASPSTAAPHLEFTIENFSQLPGLGGTVGPLRLRAFMGSLSDDGVG